MNDPQTTLERTFRQEHGRVLAALIASLNGDFVLAEDALQDAIVQAVSTWQPHKLPANPAAWLLATAKRRAIDRLRKGGRLGRHTVILDETIPAPETDTDTMHDPFEMPIPDERLKLIFTCCHPAFSQDAQVALTLRTLGGLSTAEIARAFLVPPATMLQRLVRAKAKIRDAGIPYTVPPVHQMPERLNAVLLVLYLIFNEGYAVHTGDDLTRGDLCDEAIRLCRILVELLPPDATSAEARGLLALMLLHDARRQTRVDAHGRLVLLEDQERHRWDAAKIAEGRQLLEDSLRLGAAGPYQVQAAISALHSTATAAADTDWEQIAALYDVLLEMTPSPVVAMNRAVAIAMAEGIAAGLRLLLPLEDRLQDYYPFHAACAELLRRAGEREAAADAYQRAYTLCKNTLERAYFSQRMAQL